MIRRLRHDPATPGAVLFLAFVAGGFTAIGIAADVVHNTVNVAFQVPALVSGGIGGLALIVVGAGLGHVHVSRRLSAVDQVHEDVALAMAQELAAVLEGRTA